MKAIMKPVLGIAVATALSSAVMAEDRVVRIYNWSDYIAEDTLEKFTAATGIQPLQYVKTLSSDLVVSSNDLIIALEYGADSFE